MRLTLERMAGPLSQRFLASAHGWPRLLVVALTLMLVSAGAGGADSAVGAPSLEDRQRYGFVAASPDWDSRFDVAQLGAGWYTTAPAYARRIALPGMDRFLILRIHAGYRLDPDRMADIVDLYRGSTWLVGNEPDCIWQDNVYPGEYARIYHDVHAFIKSRDPTSRIAPGGIVQASPLRLEYLDRVLDAYAARYGVPMPVDLWNIHNAILNEVSCDYDPGNCWGADIPPGIDADFGEIRSIDDNDNLELFAEQIWAFRRWMAGNGYAGMPLVISEYGVLMPDDFGYDSQRVNAFMSGTFDFLTNATDDLLGDPGDGNRLVQRWAWFSLDMPPWDPITGSGFNGNLLNPDTGAITTFGLNFASYTDGLPPLEYVDLVPGSWAVLPPPVPHDPTQTVTRSVEIQIANVGTADSGPFSVELSYEGSVGGVLEAALANVSGDGSQPVAFTLTDLPVGLYELAVWADSDQQVSESTELNNRADSTLLVPTAGIYLPAVFRGVKGTPQSLNTSIESLGPGRLPGSRVGTLGSEFREFPVPTNQSHPAQIALDAQGIVWITEHDSNKVASFDPQNGRWQEFPLPPEAASPWGLDLDPSGDVWVAATATDQILRFRAPDIWQVYDIPTPGGQPWDVAVSGGTVWFTEKAGNKIGRLLPAPGEITEYAVPTAGSQPAHLAIDGDYVWFTESAADQLGFLNAASGSFLERPTVGSQPWDIDVTSGGFPWFTERVGNRIVLFYFGTLFIYRPLDIPTPGSEPHGIVVDGDLAVWFTEKAGNKLGRFSERFGVSEFPLPTPGSFPEDIAIDSSGCVWYTAPGVDRIGRFCWTPSQSYLPLTERNRRSIGSRP